MKQVIILSLLFAFATTASCQTKEKGLKKIYLQLASGASNKKGTFVEAGIQAVLKNNWTASVSYHDIEMNPKNLPSDYEAGYVFFIFPLYDEFPVSKMSLISFTGGKLFEARRNIWFTTEAGVSIVKGETTGFSKQPIVWNGLYKSSNYTVKKEDKTTIGGMLKADFNWAFLPWMGLGAGAFANFNSIQSPVGFQLKLILGRMNRKAKLKETK